MDIERSLRVLMVAAEGVPFAKTGGLADVVSSLSTSLVQRGHHVTIVMPMYPSVRLTGRRLFKVGHVEVPLAGDRVDVRVLSVEPRAGEPTYLFLDEPSLFDRVGIYGPVQGGEWPDNARRFLTLARGALEAGRLAQQPIDILHVHDWHSAMSAVYLRELKKIDPFWAKTASVLTIHNMSFQGVFSSEQWHLTGLDDSYTTTDQLEYWGGWSMLKGGLVHADRIIAVSRTYAREVMSPPGGFGLDGVLRARSDVVQGIVNGIDVNEWDPATDESIARTYDARSWREGKRACKARLQETLGLPVRANSALFAAVGRLSTQKGFDLIQETWPALQGEDLQLVVLGLGDRAIEDSLKAWGQATSNVIVRIAFDEELARHIYAGADALLVPSRYEPCGLVQLYAMRYGCVPLAHAVGGLVDTVCAGGGASRVGYCFSPFHPSAMEQCIREALTDYSRDEAWGRVVNSAMNADWSWDVSASEYEKAYRRSIK